MPVPRARSRAEAHDRGPGEVETRLAQHRGADPAEQAEGADGGCDRGGGVLAREGEQRERAGGGRGREGAEAGAGADSLDAECAEHHEHDGEDRIERGHGGRPEAITGGDENDADERGREQQPG